MLNHRTATRTGAAFLVAGALLLAGCGSDSEGASSDEPTTTAAADTTEAAAEGVEVTDVWARKSPMATTAGAAYMNITAAEDDALVGASVSPDIAGTVEIHETVMAEEEGDMSTETTMADDEMTETTMGEDMGDEGMDAGMTMQPVEMIELPAGEEVKLEPGGYHIMLLDLVAPLEVGDTFEITLTFEKAGEQTVTAEVREA